MAKKAKVLRVTQVRSVIGQIYPHKKTMIALGLRRMHHSVEHKDTPQIRGMLKKVEHLVSVEEA